MGPVWRVERVGWGFHPHLERGRVRVVLRYPDRQGQFSPPPSPPHARANPPTPLPPRQLAGLKVYTTASPAHHATLKSLGAEAVFDYRDPEVSQKIKAASNGSIRVAFDGIGVEASTKRAAEAMGDGGGKIVTIV